MNRPTLRRNTALTQRSFWVFLLLMTFAAGMTVFGVAERRNGTLLATEGIDTAGVIVERTSAMVNSHNGRRERSHILIIHYSDTTGQVHVARQSVNKPHFDATAVGDTVALRYVRSSPTIIEYEAGSTLSDGAFIVGFAAVVAALGVVALFVWRRTLAAMRRAAQTGERRLARVLSHHRRGAKWSGRYYAKWELDGGRTRKTKAVSQARLPAIGTLIAVYFDAKSGRGWWEGEF